MTQTSAELRQSFIQYFVDRGHTAVPSSPLIPQADPTLLFTNAGMNQFKGVFLGQETRPYTRAATVQKVMRAGGKHNDLENVGYTRRHHTFFEMLGNFSFGDYFKEEAISFAWEYLTTVVGLPAEKLWVSVFREDDDAYQIWQHRIGLPSSRIVRLDEKDNFWQMGETGPCGPCSEILIDQGEALGCGRSICGVGCDCDRYLEIWNLVFMQYDRDAGSVLRPIPKASIDTGMGLERLAAVAQGVSSNFDSDLFLPLFQAIEKRTGFRYHDDPGTDRSMCVIADHLRAIAFLIADGILPSNEGRGYVLRRIVRRAARHGRLLNVTDPFLHDLTGAVVDQMGPVYHELAEIGGTIAEVTKREEERFITTLDQGLPLLNDLIVKAKAAGEPTLAGSAAFKLYDTYGFPLDLIDDAVREQGLTVDHDAFQRALEEQRERAKQSAGFSVATTRPSVRDLADRLGATQFVGYDTLETQGLVQAILTNDRLVEEAVEGQEVEVVIDATPFYAEGGGQVGDRGTLAGAEGRIEVRDTVRADTDLILHRGRVTAGRIHKGERLTAAVDRYTRQDAARNHTATHLVHAALREILGPHVKQYGSLVAPNRLRFDFAHFKPLGSRDIDDIESLVNEHVRENTAVQADVMNMQEALESGALAFFGDKYGDRVRVVRIGEFSKELCGGTHCRQTGAVGAFRIVQETGVAAGVRRIDALTGGGALEQMKETERELQEIADLLKTSPSEVVPKTRKLLATLKERERELEQVKVKLAAGSIEDAQAKVRSVAGIQVYAQQVDGLDMQELRSLSDRLRNKLQSGVLALGSVKNDKVSLLVAVTKDLTGRLRAGDLIKPMAEALGGKGGGRADLAQAGGPHPERLGAALEKIFALVEHARNPDRS